MLATIHILDEVNCKISGLSPGTCRKCVAALKFTIPHARFTPAYKLGRWDGKVSYFSVGGETQINLLEYVMPILEAEGYEIEIDDQRKSFELNIAQIDKDIISNYTWPATHPTRPNQPIELMPHQVDVINTCLANPQGIQLVPTSGGKTITTATLCKLVEHLGRTIIIVPNKQLVYQTLEDFELLKLDVGVYFGDRKDLNKQHTICTWQSLEILHKNTKNNKLSDEFDIVDMADGVVAMIVDEAHVATAAVLKNLLTRVFQHVPIRWGLTGTLPKEKYIALSIIGSIGNVIGKITASDLQEKGVLSNCEIHILQLNDREKYSDHLDHLKYIKAYNAENRPSAYKLEQSFLTSNEERLEFIANFIDNISSEGNTLVLVQNINTGEFLTKAIEDSVFISGSVKVKDRKEEYSKVATENSKCIIATFGVASTGINIPRINNLVLIEPGKSFVRTIQSVGRALRVAHDKNHAVIYDICSNTNYSKKHLIERKKFYKEQQYPFDLLKIDQHTLDN